MTDYMLTYQLLSIPCPLETADTVRLRKMVLKDSWSDSWLLPVVKSKYISPFELLLIPLG